MKTRYSSYITFLLNNQKMNGKKILRTEKLAGQAVHVNWCEKANLSNLEKERMNRYTD